MQYRPHVRLRHLRPLVELLNAEGNLIEAPFEIEIVIIDHGATSARIVHSTISISLDRTERPLFTNIKPIAVDSLWGKLKSAEQRSYQFCLDPRKEGL